MSRIGVAALFLVACAAEHPKPPPLAAQPAACTASVALSGTGTNMAQTTFGPATLDAAGITLCAHLDATQLSRAHFAASSEQRPGATSGFAATLERADLTSILDGWDLTVGDAPPQTFLNLEWGPPAGQVIDVVLWFRATGAPASTTINLDLFDPLE
jgi:hypothetical protein